MRTMVIVRKRPMHQQSCTFVCKCSTWSCKTLPACYTKWSHLRTERLQQSTVRLEPSVKLIEPGGNNQPNDRTRTNCGTMEPQSDANERTSDSNITMVKRNSNKQQQPHRLVRWQIKGNGTKATTMVRWTSSSSQQRGIAYAVSK